MSKNLRSMCAQMVSKQIIVHVTGSEIGNRCELEVVGDDYIGVKFRTGKRVYYNVAQVVSVQEVESDS